VPKSVQGPPSPSRTPRSYQTWTQEDSPTWSKLRLEPLCAPQGLLIILPTNPDVHLPPWRSLALQHAYEARRRRREEHCARHTERPRRRCSCDACVAAGRNDQVWQRCSGRRRRCRHGRGARAGERCARRDGFRVELVGRLRRGGRLRVEKGANCLICKVGDASALTMSMVRRVSSIENRILVYLP
jgi:hypothetical protein